MDSTIPRWQRWLLRAVKYAGGLRRTPRHVAFIMDGNRRFARRNQESTAIEGHRAGARTLSLMCEACLELGIQFVTVYAFALGNFHRDREEVVGLLHLAEDKFSSKGWIDGFFKRLGIRVRFVGDFSYLPPSLTRALANAAQETSTACADPEGLGCRLVVTVCIAYGSRREIARAVAGGGAESQEALVDLAVTSPTEVISPQALSFSTRRRRKRSIRHSDPSAATSQTPTRHAADEQRNELDEWFSCGPCCDAVLHAHLSPSGAGATWHSTTPYRKRGSQLWTALQAEDVPPPDLLLRTSGERRLSDFLLYETSETTAFYFLNVLWPDLSCMHLLVTVVHFQLQRILQEFCGWIAGCWLLGGKRHLALLS
ncbi:undecaprenyl diphosphate synthase [Besnoitia besnoiti]|uniref:Alkyl transferase n=1 Tax=Besnoitia besnoiti TaxID=94643 RepID=A0A2A9MCD3_BESBE|nr:undecaprenyl diphosphate synthase [Besnoitia besnoiti]PFH33586.1 undecaprenyl diphosphate synthase [Besnoitia besnoiti]